MSDKTTLKTYFNTDDTPTEGQFADLIDSVVLVSDLQVAISPYLFGSGHLHYFYERQYNYATNTGTNRRPSIWYGGDSLAFRVAGFVAQWTKEDHPGKHGVGFASEYAISSFIPPGGPVVTLSGSATAVTGAYTLWINGCYWTLGAAGAIRYEANPSGPIECEVIKIAYIAEFGAGTFQIQTSVDGVTGWTNRGGIIDANNVSQIGVVASTTISQQTVYVRVLGVSGTVKILGPVIGFPATTKGCDFGDISVGGIPPREMVRTPSAIYTPILTDLNPALFIIHFNDYEPVADPIDGYSLFWDTLITVLRAGNQNRSILFIANGPQTDATKDTITRSTRDYLVAKVNVDRIAVIDMYAMVGPFDVLDDLNWEGDTVHVSPIAYAYVAEQAYRQMIRSRFAESNRPIILGGEAKSDSAISVIGGSIAVWGSDNVTEVHYYVGGSTFNDSYYSPLAPSYSAVSNGAGSIASLGMYVFDTGLGTRVRKVWVNASATYFMKRNGSDVALALFDGASYFSGSVYVDANIVNIPAASVTLDTNGQMAFQATSNTTVTLKYRGSDGVTRSVDLTLA